MDISDLRHTLLNLFAKKWSGVTMLDFSIFRLCETWLVVCGIRVTPPVTPPASALRTAHRHAYANIFPCAAAQRCTYAYLTQHNMLEQVKWGFLGPVTTTVRDERVKM